jgi:hypothetical protein
MKDKKTKNKNEKLREHLLLECVRRTMATTPILRANTEYFLTLKLA